MRYNYLVDYNQVPRFTETRGSMGVTEFGLGIEEPWYS